MQMKQSSVRDGSPSIGWQIRQNLGDDEAGGERNLRSKDTDLRCLAEFGIKNVDAILFEGMCA